MKQIDENNFSFSAHRYQREFEVLLTALNHTDAGVVVTDCTQPDDPILYCNHTFEQLTGYSREEVIGHNCRFLQGNDDNIVQRDAIKQALLQGKACSVEIKNYKKDGSLFWNELHLEPFLDEFDKPIYYIGIQHDITQIKSLSKRLKEETFRIKRHLIDYQSGLLLDDETFTWNILDTVEDGVLLLDDSQQIIKVNRSFLKTFHMAEDELLGRNLFEMDEGKWNHMALKNLCAQLLRRKSAHQELYLENILMRRGVKSLHIHAKTALIGNQRMVIMAIKDITELKETERRKDDFLSVASHELKTPLTTIKASLELTQRMLSAHSLEKLEETLNKTTKYVDKLEHLISDLLDASKINAGKIDLDEAAFDLDGMIYQVVHTLTQKYPTHQIQVEGFASNYYIGDQLRLEQVMRHLLTNSIKFSPAGSVINIHLSRLSDFIKISITDNGLGVDSSFQKKIFDTFYRVDHIQKQYPGIGMGLYISDQIIKKHKGTLWVESTIGEGATFSFTLPLKHDHHDKENYDL